MIQESELILNPDGSVYHLNLLPEDLAHTVITVGDPERVAKISSRFSSVEVKKASREFVTHTGYYNGKRISVISTGIGTDNIDIVFNELDALVNIDLKQRTVKEKLTSLDIVRIGTSGSLQANIPVDSFVLSKYGLGLENMLHFYAAEAVREHAIETAFMKHTQWATEKGTPFVVKGSEKLLEKISSKSTFEGFTATAGGFYGPQGRVLRLALSDPELNHKMDTFDYNGIRITNFEMETSGIYGLAALLGHQALSANAIIANRANGTFSKKPKETVEELIDYVLDKLTV